jgi:hypothetical protein
MIRTSHYQTSLMGGDLTKRNQHGFENHRGRIGHNKYENQSSGALRQSRRNQISGKAKPAATTPMYAR